MLLLIIYLSFFIIFVKLYNVKNYMSPVFIFFTFQIILFIGSLQYIDLGMPADVLSVWISFLVLISITVGSFTFRSIKRYKKTLKDKSSDGLLKIENTQIFNCLLVLAMIISAGVSFLYFKAIGYNLFLDQLLSKGSVEDVATKRLQAYSGDTYFAPGYANLFKNILLPITVAFVGVRYYFLRIKFDLILFILFLPLSLIFILGTGQRGAFIIASLISLIFISMSVDKKFRKKIVGILSSFVLLFFSISTFFLNRGNEESFLGAVEGLFYRIFSSNQESAVIGFRYLIAYKEIQFGQEWITMFLGLLPGITVTGSISNEIYAVMFGTARGTAPLSNWGSVYFNFGIIGCIVVAFIIGFTYEYIFYRFKRKNKSLFRNLYYSALFIMLGSWIAGDPTSVFNKGLPIIIVIIIIHKFLFKRRVMTEVS